MTSTVIVKILVPPNTEIPNGVYHAEEFPISDAQWQNMRSALTEFEVELISMALGYHGSTPLPSSDEKEVQS